MSELIVVPSSNKKNCPHYKPHKQYHAILGSLLACMELKQGADGDEQSGKPIW